MTDGNPDITAILTRVAEGEHEAFNQLVPIVYDELHQIAQKLMQNESPANSLQPTVLVNEAYFRLVDLNRIDWQGRAHFFAMGATVMRRILVDHARHHLRVKRGGQFSRIPLNDDLRISSCSEEDVLAVEEVLGKLEELDPRQAKVVEMRFYAGLTVKEIAEALGLSKRTVESDWTIAKAWLRREFSDKDSA